MRTSLLPLLALAITTTAYKVTIYETTDCTGDKLKDVGLVDVSAGCQKIEDVKGSVKIEWTDDADNALSFTTYSGDKCCVPYYRDTLIWQDECLELGKIRSFRVVDAADIAKGKEGEDYMCSDTPAEL